MSLGNAIRIAKGIVTGHTIGEVRCLYENMGDILVGQAIDHLLDGVTVATFGDTSFIRGADRLFGPRRVFRYAMLGGGTLILSPRNVGWLDVLEALLERAEPLCTFGTGVLDPEFSARAYEAAGRKSPIDDEGIDGWMSALHRFPIVALRGIESARVLREYGLEGVEVIGDPALIYARNAIVPKQRRKRIGVNIMNESMFWPDSKDRALNEMTKFVRCLVADGWEVHLVPATSSDLAVATQLDTDMGGGKLHIFHGFEDGQAYIEAVGSMDVYAGMRLHGYIAACCTSTPGVMIGYRPKGIDFSRTIGLEQYHIRTDEVDADQLMSAVTELYASLETVQQEVFEKSQRMKTGLKAFAARIKQRVLEG